MDKTTTEVERPAWLKPGAEVVTWYPQSRSGSGVSRGRVKSVAGQSFLLEDEREPRFKIKGMEARTGSGWDRTTKRVAHAESPEGVYWLANLAATIRRQAADSATVTWQKERTLQSAADLRQALSEWMSATAILDAMERPKR